MRSLVAWPLAILLLSGAAAPALAQYEDEGTEDHEEQDRRYMERYLKEPEDDAPPPAANHEESEQAFLEQLDQMIRDRNYRAATSDNYRVQTDDPRLDPDGATELLEGFRSYFEQFWSDRTTLAPYDKQSRIFLFYSFYKFNKLLEVDFRFSDTRPKGHYGSWFDVITLHTDADGLGDLGDTLVHEAAHQLMDQQFEWTAGYPPIWVSEGIASYFGYTLADDKGFHPAIVGGKSTRLYRDGKTQKPTQPAYRLRAFKSGMKNLGEEESLYASLLWADDPAGFYGGNVDLNYSASWMLVHYLLHADDGAHAAAFVRYLELEAAGQGDADDLLADLQMTPNQLDAAVAEHARRIKIR